MPRTHPGPRRTHSCYRLPQRLSKHGMPSVSSVSRGDGGSPMSLARSTADDAAACSNETHQDALIVVTFQQRDEAWRHLGGVKLHRLKLGVIKRSATVLWRHAVTHHVGCDAIAVHRHPLACTVGPALQRVPLSLGLRHPPALTRRRHFDSGRRTATLVAMADASLARRQKRRFSSAAGRQATCRQARQRRICRPAASRPPPARDAVSNCTAVRHVRRRESV